MNINLLSKCEIDGKIAQLVEGVYSKTNKTKSETYHCDFCDSIFMQVICEENSYNVQWNKNFEEFVLREPDRVLFEKYREENLKLSEKSLIEILKKKVERILLKDVYCDENGSKIEKTVKL